MPNLLDRYPIDKTKTVHAGTVQKIIFSDDSKPFVILGLADGKTIKGNFLRETFENHNQWRFFGRWMDDAVRGPHFHAETYTLDHTRGEYGLMEYLERLALPLTRKQMRAIYVQYGDATLAKLRESPEEIAAVVTFGVSLDTAKEISQTLVTHNATAKAKIELFQLFQRRGFNSKTVERCIKAWGESAPAVIRDNPFQLMRFPSCGFRRCDKLWSELGHDPGDMKRQIACLSYVFSQDRTGNTWQKVDDLEKRFLAEIPNGDVLGAIKHGLSIRAIDKLRDDAGDLYLALYRDSLAEQNIAIAIRQLNQSATRWPIAEVPISETEGDGLPSAHQVEQLRLATASPVGLFIGGPGTGKTHTLAYLLRAVVQMVGRDRIAAIAPTGKAAQRMRESLARCEVDLDTKTVHSFLKLGVDEDDAPELDSPEGFAKSEVDFIIVDEVSMCDTTLMARLFRNLPTGTHVLLIGDPHQLPPVGHGAPLRDFIAADVARGELTEVRRNAGTIVRACAAIKSGRRIEIDDVPNLNAEDYPRNLVCVDSPNEKESAAILEDMLANLKTFDPTWQTQVIVGRNKGGELGRLEINNRLQQLLNRDGKVCGNNPFRVNDKIICLKNQKLHTVAATGFFAEIGPDAATEAKNYYPVKDENNQHVQAFIANGEVGRVIAISETQMIAQFSGRTELVRIAVSVKKNAAEDTEEGESSDTGRGCSFDLAYAVTCHKLQGSEAPFCIVLADERASLIAGREWWYTAISRASKLCMLVGSMNTIAKQCMKQTLNRRKTFLAERIREAARTLNSMEVFS